MIDIWLFRIAVLILFGNSLLVIDSLPNSMFSSKEFGLRLGSAICIILVGLKVYRLQRIEMRLKSLDIPVLVFLFLLPISAFLMDKESTNMPKTLNQINLGISYLTIRVLSGEMSRVLLIKTIIISLLVLCCFNLMIAAAQYFAIIQSYHSNFRITGMFFNPAPFAILMASFVSVLAIVTPCSNLKKRYRFLSCILSCAVISVLSICMSRSAWVGCLFGLTVAAFYHIRRKQIHFSLYAKRICLLLLVCLSPGLIYWLYYIKQASAIGRLLIWQVSISMLNENWLSGVGTGNFAAEYVQYQAAFFGKGSLNIQKYGNIAGDIRYAFNDILQVFCETGVLGLTAFMSVVIVGGVQLSRSLKMKVGYRSMFNHCVLATLVTILAAGLTSYPLSMLPLAILFWFLVASFVSINQGREFTFNIKRSCLWPLFSIVLIIAGAVYLGYGAIKFKAYKDWYSITSGKSGNFEINDLLKLQDALSTEPNYLNQIAVCYINNGQYSRAIPYLQRAIRYSPYKGFYYSLGDCYENLGHFEKAKKSYMFINQAVPSLIKPKILLAKVFYRQRNFIQFNALYLKIIKQKPKIDSEEVMEMKEELVILKNKLDNSLKGKLQ